MQINTVTQLRGVSQAAVQAVIEQGGGQDFLSVIMQLLGNGQEDFMSSLCGEQDAVTGEYSDSELSNAMQMLSGLFLHPMPFLAQQAPALSDQAVLASATGGAAIKVDTPLTDTLQQQCEHMFEVVSFKQDGQQKAVVKEQSVSETQLFPNLFGQIKAQTANAATATKQTKTMDVDELQQAVNELRFLGNSNFANKIFTAPSSAAKDTDTLDILAQVKTGILSQMDAQKNEFVIKLKPEGLGEVTVKMLETAGKITLSIFTSNQQAQNALNSHISQLQQALKPYNAEVSQVLTQNSFSMMGQGFGEHQHQHARQQNHQFAHQSERDDVTQQDGAYYERLKSALDSYI